MKNTFLILAWSLIMVRPWLDPKSQKKKSLKKKSKKRLKSPVLLYMTILLTIKYV